MPRIGEAVSQPGIRAAAGVSDPGVAASALIGRAFPPATPVSRASGINDLAVISEERFCQRYGPLIRQCIQARWRGSALRHDVDDAIQDVFLAFLRPGGALQSLRAIPPADADAYVRGVVRNTARMIERRAAQRKEVALDSDPATWRVCEDGTARVLDRAWVRGMLSQALAHLLDPRFSAVRQRRIHLLRLLHYSSLTPGEVASMAGLAPEAVHREMSRARRELRLSLLRQLQQHGGRAASQAERTLRELLS